MLTSHAQDQTRVIFSLCMTPAIVEKPDLQWSFWGVRRGRVRSVCGVVRFTLDGH